MRELTATLLAAQQQASSVPYVRVAATNKTAGVVRLDWSRLYEGPEDDYYHGVTVPGDGSLVRVRATPPADSRKLYVQRVAEPGPGSDFSQWEYTGQYNAVVVAAASLGAEVSVFWINLRRELRRIKSTDYGANWGTPEVIDYSPPDDIGGLAAAYEPGGDLAVFFANEDTLYVKKQVNGQWQSFTTWDKTVGALTGIAAVYGADWELVLTGRDTAGDYKLWSLVYGDGGDVPFGDWADLQVLATAPSGGDFAFVRPFLDRMPDGEFRCFFIEKYSGTETVSRPYRTHSVIDTLFIEGWWREPVPFDLASDYGLALAHGTDYAWISCPYGVWRAPLVAQSLDLTEDVIALRQEILKDAGQLIVELRNDDGKYNSPGQGEIAVLDIGGGLEFGPGYVTPSGNEYSGGQSYLIESYEHVSAGGRASLVIRAQDAREALGNWRARQQFRWNRSGDEAAVEDIAAYLLARVGLKLESISASEDFTGFYPDFTLSPGDTGEEALRKLLSFVPDVVFIEGSRACAVNPLASDSAVYTYGTGHPVIEGRYVRGAGKVNRVQVEGYAAGSGGIILVDSFVWDEIDLVRDRLRQIADRNIGTVEEAAARGEADLRRVEIDSTGGSILVPVNCGQQLYDVVAITDLPAGLGTVKRRVLGMVLDYRPGRGEYRQRLYLGNA